MHAVYNTFIANVARVLKQLVPLITSDSCHLVLHVINAKRKNIISASVCCWCERVFMGYLTLLSFGRRAYDFEHD